MKLSLQSAVSAFGASAKAKLSSPAISGEPEDQLRAPFEQFVADLAELCGFVRNAVAVIGESSISDLKTRPDYAITANSALIGFVELKAPGKGCDPRRFRDLHDREQWEKLQSLPNLIYTDGNGFSLWHDGELAGSIVSLGGDIETSGSKLEAPPGLLGLFEGFLRWEPIPPRSAKELARVSARLCKLLRDEVTEQLALGSEGLTALAKDWRKLLFPEAPDERFADGYAQAVTFGLLMARAAGIELANGFSKVAHDLIDANSLIGAALRLLTDNVENQATLKTSLGALTRVLDAVDWPTISRGEPKAWLYFYEDFLEVYDSTLKKRTGSYYTPSEVVGGMVQLVDEALRSPRFGQHAGLASSTVTIADPAAGTGTYVLGVLQKIADAVRRDQGEGAVQEAINAAVKRLVAFEIQLGPFAVAQLRIRAEITALTGAPPDTAIRMFVTDTLGNPEDDEGWIPALLAPIAQSRKDANKIKREEPITVVIGNPPYREKAKGAGGWIEGQTPRDEKAAPLASWIPPREWGVGAHVKHLRNLYIYFWRWATWKAFDHGPGDKTGLVCFITVAGFLNGPGFQKMRDYLRRMCDDIWIIDCSPEGHQPGVNTRIFQDVQQPVCIVLTSRSIRNDAETPAHVRFQALPAGHRETKFAALGKLKLGGRKWSKCPSEWRAPFLPASSRAWMTYPALEDLFVYNGSGVQPKRTWVIAPDAQTLIERWQCLIEAPPKEKEDLFHPTLRNGKPADRHIRSAMSQALPGFTLATTRLIDETAQCPSPVAYAYRSFNRQWIIPDTRVITQPNAELWQSRSENQVYITALLRTSPSSGPALTVTGLIPDLDHYNGRGGRVFPLWRDSEARLANVRPNLLAFLTEKYGTDVSAEDLVAYIVAVASHPAFTARFQDDLSTPGLRIPLTADPPVFADAVKVGRTVIWLHTFGERMADSKEGRPAGPPRLPEGQRPAIPKDGMIPRDPKHMPDTIDYDARTKRLTIGAGYVGNVKPEVWGYEVSGKNVLHHWFSYRRANRERPIIGKRRPPSPLNKIQTDHWLADYTTELINVLNVLGLLVETEPKQEALLERICSGRTLSVDEFAEAGAFDLPRAMRQRKAVKPSSGDLFDVEDDG